MSSKELTQAELAMRAWVDEKPKSREVDILYFDGVYNVDLEEDYEHPISYCKMIAGSAMNKSLAQAICLALKQARESE